jgi:secreted trypsin-like serine protease
LAASAVAVTVIDQPASNRREPDVRLRLVVASAATVLAGVTVPVLEANASVQPVTNIIGGDTVSSAPWAAAVFSGNSPFCSGTIISPTFVLTAKHCVVGDGSSQKVRVGSVRTSSGGSLVPVLIAYFNDVSPRADPHDPKAAVNSDLALLELTTPVSTTYVKLAASGTRVAGNTVNTIYGWGAIHKDTGGMSPTLKTASVTVKDTTSQTDNEHGPAIWSVKPGGLAWRGDSGGPEFDTSMIQVGVASLADGSTGQVYASVGAAVNRDWIKKVAGV